MFPSSILFSFCIQLYFFILQSFRVQFRVQVYSKSLKNCQKRKQFAPKQMLQTLLRSEMVSLGYFFRMSMIFFLAVELSTLGSPTLEVLGRMERRSDLLFDRI